MESQKAPGKKYLGVFTAGQFFTIVALITLVSLVFCGLITYVVYDQSRPEPAVLPIVTIDSPTNGSQVQVGQDITVQATATDSKGVAYVELLINGVREASDAGPPQGQSPFLFQKFWRPMTPGLYTLEIKAYSVTAGKVGTATVSVYAVEATATPVPGEPTTTPTATSTPEEPTPIFIVITPPAPEQPGCTVGAQGLNVRSGPGTNYPVVGGLRAGQVIGISGKNTAGTWWRIQEGQWVSNGYCVGNAAAANVLPFPDPPTPTPTMTPKPQCSPNCPSDQAEWVTMPAGTHLYDLLRTRGWKTDAELAEKRELVRNWSCLTNVDQIPAGSRICLPLPCKTIAPELVGKVVGEAMGLAVDAKFKPVPQSPSCPAGSTPTNLVISTTPRSGETALCHSPITLTIGCSVPVTQTLPWWINGHVSDFTGGPIGGVQVTCWRVVTDTEEVIGISITNGDGAYDMVSDFPDVGGLHCEARKTGYQLAKIRYPGKSERNNRAYAPVDFVLTTVPTTTRTVKIFLTNSPLGGPEKGLVAFTVGSELGDKLTREVEVGSGGTWQGTIEVPNDRLNAPLKFHAEHQHPTLYLTEGGESQLGGNETYEIRVEFSLIPPASGQNKGEWALPIVAEYLNNPSWQNLYIQTVVGSCYRQLPDGTQEVWLQFVEGLQGVNHILKPDGTRQKNVEQSPKPPWCPSPIQGGRYSNIGMGAFYVPQVPWTTVFTYWVDEESGEWYWKSYSPQ